MASVGRAMLEWPSAISLGIISGSTPEHARGLWQRAALVEGEVEQPQGVIVYFARCRPLKVPFPGHVWERGTMNRPFCEPLPLK